jgi:DNA-binding protein YbaB
VIQQLMQAWQEKPMSVSVNVGMGATDPHTKLQKFTAAAQTYAGIMSTIPDADPEAVKKEVFGLAGYRDGSRFFKQQDNPANAQMMQQMQEMQQALQEMGQKMAKQELQLADKSGSLQIAAFDAETKRLQVTKPETANDGPTAIDAADAETKRISAVADARLKDAQIDLVQAQAAKTVVEAALAPSQAMAAQATNVE